MQLIWQPITSIKRFLIDQYLFTTSGIKNVSKGEEEEGMKNVFDIVKSSSKGDEVVQRGELPRSNVKERTSKILFKIKNKN